MKCDAVKLASLLEKKEVTQEEVIEASFSRLDEVESILEATTYTRKEKALHEVEEVEARPFRGVPLYLKDSSQAIAEIGRASCRERVEIPDRYVSRLRISKR